MIQHKTLENGVRIVAERLEHVRSASIGIWVKNGSRHEEASLSGISHFIEHMVFKGTQTRDVTQIAVESDDLGGQIDAFTDKECTCYTMKVLDCDIQKAVDLLSDMVLHPAFPEEELTLERGVVLEEIDMYEDSPEDVAIERLYEACYAESLLGKPILGAPETLATMTSDTLRAYHAVHYGAQNLVVAISGNFSDADLSHLEACFAEVLPTAAQSADTAHYQPALVRCEKNIEQNHLCMSFEAPSALSDERYALSLLSGVLGLGMSSRLFQTIREKHGLCYTIYSFTSTMQDTGTFSIYTGLGRKTEARAIALIVDCLRDVCENGITQEELNRCRKQVTAGILMGLESTETRMMRLGKNMLARDSVPSTEETLARYEAITTAQITALAQRIFVREKCAFSCVGAPLDMEAYETLLDQLPRM